MGTNKTNKTPQQPHPHAHKHAALFVLADVLTHSPCACVLHCCFCPGFHVQCGEDCRLRRWVQVVGTVPEVNCVFVMCARFEREKQRERTKERGCVCAWVCRRQVGGPHSTRSSCPLPLLLVHTSDFCSTFVCGVVVAGGGGTLRREIRGSALLLFLKQTKTACSMHA